MAGSFQQAFPACEAFRKPSWQVQGAGAMPAPYFDLGRASDWMRAASLATATKLQTVAQRKFSILNDTVLALLEAVPELRGEPDLGATNERVTILWLK